MRRPTDAERKTSPHGTPGQTQGSCRAIQRIPAVSLILKTVVINALTETLDGIETYEVWLIQVYDTPLPEYKSIQGVKSLIFISFAKNVCSRFSCF